MLSSEVTQDENYTFWMINNGKILSPIRLDTLSLGGTIVFICNELSKIQVTRISNSRVLFHIREKEVSP